MTHNVGLGLPLNWKAGLIGWAKVNLLIRELWMFGSRARGTARVNSVVDLGVVLMRAKRGKDRAFENYVTHYLQWHAELETIVQCHVSLVPLIRGDDGDEIIRSTGICLWERLTSRQRADTKKPRR